VYVLTLAEILKSVFFKGVFMNLQDHIEAYLTVCAHWKNLNRKTIKAYRLDLEQFCALVTTDHVTRRELEKYIAFLQISHKSSSLKRKIAALRGFFEFIEFEYNQANPFARTHFRLKEPPKLPRTIPLGDIERLLKAVYDKLSGFSDFSSKSEDDKRYKSALRDAAVLELLFATGIRVSELCGLSPQDVNLTEGVIRVQGKGKKARLVHIGNLEVLQILQDYKACFADSIRRTGAFFINQADSALQPPSVRLMLRRLAKDADIDLHITPHMFRHSFATLLLEADVDIRYIQQLLGHSSIMTTQIYTHVTTAKQKALLTDRHPRNTLNVR
jgi:integrase/recombinase XerD